MVLFSDRFLISSLPFHPVFLYFLVNTYLRIRKQTLIVHFEIVPNLHIFKLPVLLSFKSYWQAWKNAYFPESWAKFPSSRADFPPVWDGLPYLFLYLFPPVQVTK